MHLGSIQGPSNQIISVAVTLVDKNFLTGFGQEIKGIISPVSAHKKEVQIEISTGGIVNVYGFAVVVGLIIMGPPEGP